MPGSWEFRPEVLIGVLSHGTVPTQWAFALRNLQLPQNSNIVYRMGLPFDHARNSVCEEALTHNFKWVGFLDSDTICPQHGFLKLIQNNLDVQGMLYYRRSKHGEPAPWDPNNPIPNILSRTMMKPVASWDKEGKMPEFALTLPYPSICEIDLIGSGAMLIRTDILRKMPKPWFKWAMGDDSIPQNQQCSEDYYFCRKARKMGHKIYLDTSLICAHIGFGSSSCDGTVPGLFEPLG